MAKTLHQWDFRIHRVSSMQTGAECFFSSTVRAFDAIEMNPPNWLVSCCAPFKNHPERASTQETNLQCVKGIEPHQLFGQPPSLVWEGKPLIIM